MTYMRIPGLLAASLIAVSVTAEAHQGTPQTLCEARLANILPQGFTLTIDDRPDHNQHIQELQNEKDRLTRDGRLPVSTTQIRGQIQLEHVGFLLSRGNAEQILPIARTAASLVDRSYEKLVELGEYIVAMQAMANRTDAQTKDLVDAEILFLAESKTFGEHYGFTKHVMDTLESVANGQGVPEIDTLVNYEGNDGEVVLDLTTQSAVKTAKRVLELWKWNGFSGTSEIRAMYGMNHYAMRAKLEGDIKDLQMINSRWRRWVNTYAQVLIEGSDKIPFLPERYRQFFLRLLGVQANQFMKELYHGKIQELVGITRARTSDGKLVLVKDKRSLDTLLATVEDMSAATIGNDLLTTFARTRYFAKSWSQLLDLARERASKDATYRPLLTKLEAAEKSRQSAGDLPYLYEPNNRQELTLVAAQASYMLAIEEYAGGGIRNWLIPAIQQFLQ